MERVTIYTPYGYEPINPIDLAMDEYSDINFEQLIDKLGQYEDAEEQGLLPKFHISDEFWIIGCCKRIVTAKVVMLQQKKDKTWKYRLCDTFSHTHDYKESEFAVKFFLTKEEAEQALKQMGE